MHQDDAPSAWVVFLVFLRLGLLSFGGPVAHLGYFHNEFVRRRRWLSERNYADLVALCQFLPGPASSQVGMAIGLSRAGFGGALAAWMGFTLPSALALILFALGLSAWGDALPMGILHGLKVVAVAVVAQAVWGMATRLCTDTIRVTIAIAVACAALLWPAAAGQVLVIVIAAAVGIVLFKPGAQGDYEAMPVSVNRLTGVFLLCVFFILLGVLPLLADAAPGPLINVVDAFYRAGSLVFGGGHVVLPLLQAEVVPSGWVSNETFLAGYGAAQAVPGPLFTFAAFLGASMDQIPDRWLGGLVCLGAIFLPSFLLVAGALPFWNGLRRSLRIQAGLAGVNAAVVGLLLAALYNPVWTSAVHTAADFSLVLVALLALVFWKLPPWLVVLGSAALGWTIGPVGLIL